MSVDELSIIDVSLRDGIQNESTFIPMALRLKIIEILISSGVRQMQVASFVNSKRVPQMQGIEEFIDLLPNKEGILYSALVLNETGLNRLQRTPLKQVDLSLSCSDTHSRKNTGLSRADAVEQTLRMITSAKNSDLFVRVGLQCAFGCNYEGDIPTDEVMDLVRPMMQAGCDAISLADSTGQALPEQIKDRLQRLQEITDKPIILHLHDTYGMGIANFLAAYQVGVRSFDASLGGLGGCPFIPGATGNLALEDLVHLCDRLGFKTGIEIMPLLAATQLLELTVDHPLPGKIHQILRHPRMREARLGTDSRTKNSELQGRASAGGR